MSARLYSGNQKPGFFSIQTLPQLLICNLVFVLLELLVCIFYTFYTWWHKKLAHLRKDKIREGTIPRHTILNWNRFGLYNITILYLSSNNIVASWLVNAISKCCNIVCIFNEYWYLISVIGIYIPFPISKYYYLYLL